MKAYWYCKRPAWLDAQASSRGFRLLSANSPGLDRPGLPGSSSSILSARDLFCTLGSACTTEHLCSNNPHPSKLFQERQSFKATDSPWVSNDSHSTCIPDCLDGFTCFHLSGPARLTKGQGHSRPQETADNRRQQSNA